MHFSEDSGEVEIRENGFCIPQKPISLICNRAKSSLFYSHSQRLGDRTLNIQSKALCYLTFCLFSYYSRADFHKPSIHSKPSGRFPFAFTKLKL